MPAKKSSSPFPESVFFLGSLADSPLAQIFGIYQKAGKWLWPELGTNGFLNDKI